MPTIPIFPAQCPPASGYAVPPPYSSSRLVPISAPRALGRQGRPGPGVRLYAELARSGERAGQPKDRLADPTTPAHDAVVHVVLDLFILARFSPGVGQMPCQLLARLARLQLDRLSRHVRFGRQGRRRAVVQTFRRRAPDGCSGSATVEAVGAASADALLLWPSSARLRDGHIREEEEARRGDGNPDEVVLVPMLLPVLRYGSACLALRALARDARPVMHSHVMPGRVLRRPTGLCLALALLE